jgi:hypothetical protein
MMRWGILAALVCAFAWLLASAAMADGPAWALISTEIDDGLDGAGTFMDRQMLTLWPPTYSWSYDSNDVFFDPATIFGIETGLDAFHVMHESTGDLYFFRGRGPAGSGHVDRPGQRGAGRQEHPGGRLRPGRGQLAV